MAEEPSPIATAEEMARRLARIENMRPPPHPLESSGGGGDSTGMEPRVAKLEAYMEGVRADVASLKADVSTLKVDVATLRENVRHLPTKGFIVGATATTLALIAALSIFGPSVQRLAGLAPAAPAPTSFSH